MGPGPPNANSEDFSETDAMAVAQPVSAPLTRAAVFLVVTITPGADNRAAARRGGPYPHPLSEGKSRVCAPCCAPHREIELRLFAEI